MSMRLHPSLKPPYTGPKYKVIAKRTTRHGYVEHNAMYGMPNDNFSKAACNQWAREMGYVIRHFVQEWALEVVLYDHPTTPWPDHSYEDN